MLPRGISFSQPPAVNVTLNYDIKTTINNFLVNGFYDIRYNDTVKPFIGLGVGVSNVSYKYVEKNAINAPDITTSTQEKKATKNTIATSAALYLGVAVELASNIHTEVNYNLKLFGKIDIKDKDTTLQTSFRYLKHGITVGFRYSI